MHLGIPGRVVVRDADIARRRLAVLGEYASDPTDLDALDPFAERERGLR